jgi:hypothetical protein
LKPVWGNSLRDPISKTPNTKESWQNGSSGSGSSEFKPQSNEKKKKLKENIGEIFKILI